MILWAGAASITNVEIAVLAACVVGFIRGIPSPLANHTLSFGVRDPLASDFALPSILLTRWIAFDRMQLVAVHWVLLRVIWVKSREGA